MAFTTQRQQLELDLVRFSERAGRGSSAVVTHTVEGPQEGLWFLEIRMGGCRAYRGTSLPRNAHPPRTPIGPQAWSYCRVPGAAVSYKRGNPVEGPQEGLWFLEIRMKGCGAYRGTSLTKPPTPLGPPWGPKHGPTVGS